MRTFATTLFVFALFAANVPCQQAALIPAPAGVGVQVPLISGPVIARVTAAQISELRTIRVPGWSGLAVSWVETLGGDVTPWSAISLDGARMDRVTETDHDLRLRYARFDPLREQPVVHHRLTSPRDSRLWIVQWHTQGLEPYRQAIRAAGAEVHLYMPLNAQVVTMDYGALERVRSLSCVRAVTPFHPAYRLSPALRAAAELGLLENGSVRVNILSLRRGMTGQGPIAERIEALGGLVHDHSPETYLMSATLNLDQLIQVARMDEVQWVDRWSAVGADVDVAREFVGANSVALAGFDGSGVRGEVHDIGTQLTHPELYGSVAHGSPGSHAHGTSTAAEVFGSGLNPLARGICPQGTAIVTDANNYVGSRYGHTMQSVDPNGPYRAVFLTSSVGSAQITAYTSVSQNLDLITFDSHLVHLQSQSNTGTTASRPEAWAKNVISVGGINHFNTVTDADDAWTTASTGPAADGRMKPNMAAFHDAIYTATSGSGYTGSFGGTSGATPIVAGCVGLIHEMWHAGAFGNPTGASVFESRPSDTLVRALLFAAARPWDFVGGGHNLARTRQGWGRPDVAKLYDRRDRLHWVNESEVLSNLQTTTRYVHVSAGTPELRIAMVWADPPGTTSANLHRVNDLDLTVTSPTGVVYRGNNGLLSGIWSASGGARDTINTEECVFLPWPSSGTWRIDVTASEVNQDGHVETPAVDVDFSLAVLGANPSAVGAPFDLRLSTTGGGVGDGVLGLDNLPATTNSGYCLFSFAAFGAPGSGPMAGLWPDALTMQCAFSPVAPGNPMHWTWPAPNLFPAADLILPPGTLAMPAGSVMDGLGVALDGQGAVLGTTPVRRIVF